MTPPNSCLLVGLLDSPLERQHVESVIADDVK